jgi:hypothetical protein
LSAAMREAIAKGAEEGERDAKRAKVETITSESGISPLPGLRLVHLREIVHVLICRTTGKDCIFVQYG